MSGIYIHIPFCRQKCSYCDFHFSTTFGPYRERMIDAINQELIKRSKEYIDQKTETIYFGGGTPSLLTNNELQTLLKSIYENYNISEKPEITLETNPDDITPENVQFWKESGINRLSIGIQSFRKQDLEWMNRAHNAEEAINSISLARKYGIENFSIDLIYGLPDLSNSEWEAAVQQVIDYNVPHISAYCLTIEEKTALHKWVKEGSISKANEETQSEQFLILLKLLEENGYLQYEISNFSKPGFESRHNSSYWKGTKYIGVGPSAHSFNGIVRRWNVANNFTYMSGIEKGEDYFEMEELSDADRFNELVLTGLRTSYGVDLNALDSISERPEEFNKDIADFIEKGWIEKEDDRIFLTPEGRLRADYIASSLFILS